MDAVNKTYKRLLVRSVAQEVNIGDIAQGPGILALIEKYIPEAEVKLLASGATPEIQHMIKKRFPNIEIIRGRFINDGNDIEADDKQKVIDVCKWADYYVQGSGPWADVEDIKGFVRISGGKRYGIFGVSYPETPDTKEVLSNADFVYFRDCPSLERAIKDGVNCPLMQFGADSAFAFDIKNDKKANLFMTENKLEAGKFVCIIPRYRYTPYWEIRDTDFIEARDKVNQKHKEQDNAPLREAALRIVDETDMKVVVCPEDATQMKLGQEIIIDKLPKGYESKFILHKDFWLPDEALGLYSKSAGVFCNEMHSPIISIGNGIPATVGRWAEQTTKGIMWKNIGLSDWLFNIDEEADRNRVVNKLLEIIKNPSDSSKKVSDAQKTVQGCHEDMTKTLKYFLTGEGKIFKEHTSVR